MTKTDKLIKFISDNNEYCLESEEDEWIERKFKIVNECKLL